MLRRIVISGVEARKKLTDGANKLADAVKSTFGVYGQTWYLDKRNSITNDGVSVAREIVLDDEVENRGAIALREAAIKTVDSVGDGTTTAIILAQAIYQTVSKYLSKEGVIGSKTPSEVIRQIEEERIMVTDKLEGMAEPITTEQGLIYSATVATGDKELGILIGKAQWKLGKDGYLLAEESADKFSSVEYVKGIRIDNGFGTSQLVNDQEKQMLVVEDTKVLLTSHTIRDIHDWQKIMKVCELIAKTGATKLVIIARAWTDDTIRFCLENINKGTLKIYPLNAPYTDMQERMHDLSSIIGGNFVDSENSTLDDVVMSDLGFAMKVVARRYDAVVTGGDSIESVARVSQRCYELEEQRRGSQSDFEKKAITERLAQLQDGFALIKVGSPSDLERKRLYDKCEDAVHAVRAAYREGTVKGAGLAFKEIADTLPDSAFLRRALYSLNEQIVSSAPKDFVIEDWVRDPVLVLKVALQNACTAAASFASAGGVITAENPKRLDELLGRK